MVGGFFLHSLMDVSHFNSSHLWKALLVGRQASSDFYIDNRWNMNRWALNNSNKMYVILQWYIWGEDPACFLCSVVNVKITCVYWASSMLYNCPIKVILPQQIIWTGIVYISLWFAFITALMFIWNVSYLLHQIYIWTRYLHDTRREHIINY